MTTPSKKILVVDDEKSIREIMKITLFKLGYLSETAKNGKDALELLQNEDFPIILMDLRLPDIDGVELCERIRKINPDAVIYAFSGGFTEVDSDQLEKMGFDGFLCKPVKIKVLESAIEGAFEKIDKKRERLSIPSL